MVTRVSDLHEYEEPMPDRWQLAIRNIQQSGDLVEAEKLRMQMALLSTQASIDLFVNDEANRRARLESQAADKRAAASDTIARSLRLATWVLAVATIALVAATVVLAARGG